MYPLLSQKFWQRCHCNSQGSNIYDSDLSKVQCSNATSALTRVLGPGFISMSIFKIGLLLSLKTDFDQESDKGKKQVANYLNSPNTLDLQHGEQTTICELNLKRLKMHQDFFLWYLRLDKNM